MSNHCATTFRSPCGSQSVCICGDAGCAGVHTCVCAAEMYAGHFRVIWAKTGGVNESIKLLLRRQKDGQSAMAPNSHSPPHIYQCTQI